MNNHTINIGESNLSTYTQSIQLLSEIIIKPYPELKDIIHDLSSLSRNYSTDKIIEKLGNYHLDHIEKEELQEVVRSKISSLKFASKILELQFNDPFVINLLKNWHQMAVENLENAWNYYIDEWDI